VALAESVGVIVVTEAADADGPFELHIRVIADDAVSVVLEPTSSAHQLPARFGLVNPVTGRWFHEVAEGTYRVLALGSGLEATGTGEHTDEPDFARVVSLRPPAAIDTTLPAAAAGSDEQRRWHRLYREADNTFEVELVESEQRSGKVTIAARSKEPLDALSIVLVSLDAGATPYLIPLALSDQDCRGEITVDLPKAVVPTVEAGLWSFDLRLEDHDCLIRSIAATRPRGRTRRTWAQVAEHATRNGLDSVETEIRAALEILGAAIHPA
jgi:hypothetical protein